MFNGPFAQYNPFFQPSFANYQGGFNPQFNPQFGSQFGIPYGYFPAATSFGAPAGWNAVWNTSPLTGNFGSPFAGQFPGNFQPQSGQFPWTGQNGSFVGGNTTSGGAWNPVVTQTSDAFNGGPTTGPTSATFTPYSYNQPFFPGYSGQTTPTAFGNGFAPQTSPQFGSQFGSQFGGPLGTQFGTQFGPQAAFGGFNTQPAFSSAPAFFNPGWYGNAPTNSFPTFGSSVYNGYTTFPSFVGAAGFGSTPGFSGWNQASAGTPAWGWTNSFPGQFPGQFANQFQGQFPPQFAAQFGNFGGTPFGGTTGGATNQGWFPGQATFPWYTPVNATFNGQNTTQPGNPYGPQFGGQYGSQFGGIAGGPSIPGGPTNTATRPTDATDATQPRGIQFNRDAA